MARVRPRDALKSKKAKDLFKEIYEMCNAQYGEVNRSTLHMINDIAMLEDIKQMCLDDIFEKGVSIQYKNGENQFGTKDNPLIVKVSQVTEQQRKLMNDLKLGPGIPALESEKTTADKKGGDEFDHF